MFKNAGIWSPDLLNQMPVNGASTCILKQTLSLFLCTLKPDNCLRLWIFLLSLYQVCVCLCIKAKTKPTTLPSEDSLPPPSGSAGPFSHQAPSVIGLPRHCPMEVALPTVTLGLSVSKSKVSSIPHFLQLFRSTGPW